MAEWKGTKENLIEVSADDILNAIVKGEDIKVEYAVIKGDLDINITAMPIGLNRDEKGRYIICRDISILRSEIQGKTTINQGTFNGNVYFSETTFSRDAYFFKATFNGDVYFWKATFSENIYFIETTFNGNVHFDEATFTFSDVVDFSRTRMKFPATFGGINYEENSVHQIQNLLAVFVYIPQNYLLLPSH